MQSRLMRHCPGCGSATRLPRWASVPPESWPRARHCWPPSVRWMRGLGIRSQLLRASTDANIPLSLGLEAVALGAGGTGGGAHTVHEWFDPAGREQALKRLALLILVLAGAPPAGIAADGPVSGDEFPPGTGGAPGPRSRPDAAFGQGASAVAGGDVCLGATFIVIKSALADASPLVFNAVRMSLATVVLWAIFRRELRQLTKGAVRAGFEIGTLMWLGYEFQTAGLVYTSASKSAFLTGICVVLVPLLLAVFWGRHVNRYTLGGVCAALAGLYLLCVPPGQGSRWAR